MRFELNVTSYSPKLYWVKIRVLAILYVQASVTYALHFLSLRPVPVWQRERVRRPRAGPDSLGPAKVGPILVPSWSCVVCVFLLPLLRIVVALSLLLSPCPAFQLLSYLRHLRHLSPSQQNGGSFPSPETSSFRPRPRPRPRPKLKLKLSNKPKPKV